MKIDEVRASFMVYLIASDVEAWAGVIDTLGLAGYMTASFAQLDAAFSEIPSNPPHFIIFSAAETKFNLPAAIKQIRLQLPESHVFVLTPLARRAEFVSLLGHGIYDLIYTPLAAPAELLRALDRAAERDYFMYLSERKLEPAPAPVYDNPYLRQIFTPKIPDDCVRLFLKQTTDRMENCAAVYLKYVPNRRVLLATFGVNLAGIQLGGLGVNLNAPGSQFKSAALQDPGDIPELVEFVRDVFGTPDFFAFPVAALNDVQGVVVFLREMPAAEVSQLLAEDLILMNKALGLLEFERRLHATAVKDPGTELLNRPNFLTKMQQEVSRARRTSLPVALLEIAIDPLPKVVEQLGIEEAATLMRVIARILEKQSRVNDILGRTGEFEIGMVLPNTGREGAMIKAERLRRLIEAADFSKVLAAFPRITLSIGVSEYPRLVRDAEELMASASEALFSVRSRGNKTCVATAPTGFEADFTVREGVN